MSEDDHQKYNLVLANIIDNDWLHPARLSELGSGVFYVCDNVGRIDAPLVEAQSKDWHLMVQSAFKQLG